MPLRPLTTTIVLMFALVAALSGCGRRGELEPPASTVAPAGTQAGTSDQNAPKQTPPDRHFALDPLIQ
jgi:predicted small lipoprotein YifL